MRRLRRHGLLRKPRVRLLRQLSGRMEALRSLGRVRLLLRVLLRMLLLLCLQPRLLLGLLLLLLLVRLIVRLPRRELSQVILTLTRRSVVQCPRCLRRKLHGGMRWPVWLRLLRPVAVRRLRVRMWRLPRLRLLPRHLAVHLRWHLDARR